jgi:inhibitor of KinA sporulation pathway (predicted exonuclease)
MKSIVIDLELNQAETGPKIIEIGAFCIDLKGRSPSRSWSMLVNPQETLVPAIIELTGITQQEVDSAESLETVLKFFWAWVKDIAQTKNLSAWGNDYWHVIEASKALSISYPDRLRCLNIKEFASVFRSCFPQAKQKGGLKPTMELFGLEFEGRQHRAEVDARNTAKLLLLLKDNMSKFFEIQRIMR